MATPRPDCMHTANMSQPADQEAISCSLVADEFRRDTLRRADRPASNDLLKLTLNSRTRLGHGIAGDHEGARPICMCLSVCLYVYRCKPRVTSDNGKTWNNSR